MAAKHGGNLNQVANRYGGDPEQWADLSTGVSPFTYPAGEIPQRVWNRLPEDDDGLEAAAKAYYAAPQEPVAVAGSQAAIMALPYLMTLRLGRCGSIALPRVGYKEHQHAWTDFEQNNQEWDVEYYDGFPTAEQIESCDIVLVINPNNPLGKFCSESELKSVHTQLAERGACLIVDEAFADCTPEISMLSTIDNPQNLIVLRSIGKFFGLAGARCGFLFAESDIRQLLREYIGPWTVSGPARWVLKKALADRTWQTETNRKIKVASHRLNNLLEQYLGLDSRGTDLFTTVYMPNAPDYYEFLCQYQVLTRLCDEKDALRFGLPASEDEWQKLEYALSKLAEHQKEENVE